VSSESRTDAAIMLANKPWDTAAGVILAREANGLVADADGDHHTLRSASTVAASAELLDQVFELDLRSGLGTRELDVSDADRALASAEANRVRPSASRAWP
jgi:hypothetical protein